MRLARESKFNRWSYIIWIILITDGSWGVFRLTDPPGMKSVLGCTKTGLFHPHDETNIYTDALRPGHVYEAEGLHFDIVDLRQIQ